MTTIQHNNFNNIIMWQKHILVIFMHRRIQFAIWFANFMKNVITQHFYKWTVQIFDCLCYKNGVVTMHNIKIGDQINPMTN